MGHCRFWNLLSLCLSFMLLLTLLKVRRNQRSMETWGSCCLSHPTWNWYVCSFCQQQKFIEKWCELSQSPSLDIMLLCCVKRVFLCCSVPLWMCLSCTVHGTKTWLQNWAMHLSLLWSLLYNVIIQFMGAHACFMIAMLAFFWDVW